MHELLAFFVRNSKWWLFILYMVLGSMLLSKSNPYQHHVYLTSANAVASSVYKVTNNVYSYFNLREANADLNHRNAALQQEVVDLQRQIQDLMLLHPSDTMIRPDSVPTFKFVVASVISNSVSKPYNYITLNRGAADGIEPEMGVIDQNGVVGIVNVVGEHSSRVISLLNSNLKISCKIKGSAQFGSLVWDGKDPQIAELQELPRHAHFHPGDTIVTSGYSAVFPGGLPVGVVIDDGEHKNENFFTLRIKLLTDFTRLSNVQVISNSQRDELKRLQDADPSADKGIR